MTVWRLEFFGIAPDGKRIGPDVVTDGSTSLEEVVAKAESIMRTNTFHFWRPALCVIKSHDGSVVR
jgi:hypothetical protein